MEVQFEDSHFYGEKYRLVLPRRFSLMMKKVHICDVDRVVTTLCGYQALENETGVT